MRRTLLSVLALAVPSSCSAASDPSGGEPGRAVRSLSEISGPWDIASFNGYTPFRLQEGVRRAFVDVGASGLSYAIECNYSGNPARIDEAGILHDESDGTRLQTMAGCGREGEAREDALFGFFGTRPKVSWGEDGRLIMAGARGELVLERPEVRRLANLLPPEQLSGRWLPQMALRLEDNGHSGYGFQQPSPLIITAGRIDYGGCGGIAFSFRYTADGRLHTEDGPEARTCGQDSNSTALLRVLRSDPLVERMRGGTIALTAGREVITLQSEAERLRLERRPAAPPANAATQPPRPASGRQSPVQPTH